MLLSDNVTDNRRPMNIDIPLVNAAFSRDEICVATNQEHDFFPDHLRPAGMLHYWDDERACSDAYDMLTLAFPEFFRLPKAMHEIARIHAAPPRRPSCAIIHGVLPDGQLGDLYEAVSLTFRGVRMGRGGGDSPTSTRVWAEGKGNLGELVDMFAARPPEARAARLTVGSIAYLEGGTHCPEPDRDEHGNPMLSCARWESEHLDNVRRALEPLAKAGLDLLYCDGDFESADLWNCHYAKQYGERWLADQIADAFTIEQAIKIGLRQFFPQWMETHGKPGDVLGDWTRWQSHDPRYRVWDWMVHMRAIEEQRLLADVIREFFPNVCVGQSNAQYQLPRWVPVTRRPPFGIGATLGDYSSVKLFRAADASSAASAALCSTSGVRLWLEDRDENDWAWSPDGIDAARDAMDLTSLPPILSVQGGVPRADVLGKLEQLVGF